MLATALVLGASGAMAASTAGQFNVNVTLTPKCEIFDTGGAIQAGTITDLALTYTSFQPDPAKASTNFKVRCTKSLAYGLSIDGTSMTESSSGLQVTLALSNDANHSSTPNASLTTLSGNGNTGQTYYVHGTIAANQDGTVIATGASNKRILTITY